MALQYNVTLAQLVGAIKRIKPNVDPLSCRDWLNQRVRSVLDRRPFWSGTLKRGTLYVPASYSTGTISLTNGSTAVTGSSTAWTTNDVVNTTLPDGITKTGAQSVTPASMTGIDVDTVLYVDASGTPEVVAVTEVGATHFVANFQYVHNASCTATASSQAGRQLRLGGSYPTYTIRAIASATSAILDNEWAGSAVSGSTYSLVQMYYTLAPDIKDLISMVDPAQPAMLELHVSQETLNGIDPQRTASGGPYVLADHSPNENGSMQYELYPIQTSAKHLYYLYAQQWPEMKANGDKPPHFINPNVFLYGALSMALRTKKSRDDEFYDPVQANYYEQRAEFELQEAMKADESKAQMAYQHHAGIFMGHGGDWAQTHAVAADDSRWW